MNIKDKLDTWDEDTFKPIMSIIGKTIENAIVKGAIKPTVDIVGGTIVVTIENLADIYCAYQEAITKFKVAKENEKNIRKIVGAINDLQKIVIDIISDDSKPVDFRKIKDIYFRVKILSSFLPNKKGTEIINNFDNILCNISANRINYNSETIIIDMR